MRLLRRSRWIALAAAMAAANVARTDAAQSWVGPDGGSWSDPANWLATPPDNGDVPWFVRGGETIAVIQDLPNVTLDGLVFDSPGRFLIQPGSPGNTITLTGSATLDARQSNSGSPSLVPAGHYIGLPLLGSAGLHKIGNGIVTLDVTSSYSGGTSIDAGVLTTLVGDGAFGDLGGSITLGGGTLRVAGDPMSSRRNLLVTGDSTIQTLNSATFSVSVGGSGALNKTGPESLVLSGVNTHSGAVNIHSGALVLSVTGAVTGSAAILAGGTIVLDNTSASVNRIGDSAAIRFLGSAITVGGSNFGGVSETVGDATFDGGITFVSPQPTGQNVSLTMASASRAERGTVFFRGNNLGQSPGGNAANVYFTTPPALIGGGGAAGSTTISIIPWAWGGGSNNLASNNAAASFVTYGPNGVRPLAPAEYATSIGAGVSTNNVRLESNTTLNSAATINSLLMVNATATPITISGSGTLGIASGAILNLAGLGTINTAVNFGSVEGILHTTSLFRIGGKISGSSGLTKSGFGSLRLASATNDYTGPTTVLAGDVTYIGDVIAGLPGPLGSDTSAVVLAPGGLSNPAAGGFARLWAGGSGTTLFGRDLIVRGNPAGVGGFGTSGAFAGQVVVMNGNIQVETHLQFQGDPDTPLIINGEISGPGMLSDGFSSAQVVSGPNTYTGGTEIRDGQWIVGPHGLGTGTIWFATAGGRLSATIDDVGLIQPVVFLEGPTINGDKTLWLGSTLDLGGATHTHTITNTATTTYQGRLFNGGLIKSGAGVLRLEGDNRHAGGTTIESGTLLAARGTALGAGSVVVNSGTLRLAPGLATAYSIGGLSVTAPGVADITDNRVAIDYTGASPLPAFVQMLNDGRLVSSSVAPGQTIAIAESSVLYPSGGAFHGVPVDPTMLLLSFTFAGDSDLDGDVDVADLGNLASNWQTSATWTGGDFDHSGFVDVNDLGLLASNWQAGVGSATEPTAGPWALDEALASVGLSSVTVPEPRTALLALLLSILPRRGRAYSRRPGSLPGSSPSNPTT